MTARSPATGRAAATRMPRSAVRSAVRALTAPPTASASVRIALATDIHVESESNPIYNAAYAAGRANVIAWRDLMNSAPRDVHLILGDMYQDIDVDMADAASILSTLTRKRAIYGNHDAGYANFGQWAARTKSLPVDFDSAGLYYSFDVGFVHIICLNSSYDSDNMLTADSVGRLPDAQLAWLTADLAATMQPAVLIAVHHPPQSLDGSGATAFDATDLATLNTIVNSRANVWIVSGHWHPGTMNTRTLGSTTIYVLKAMAETPVWYLMTFALSAGGVPSVSISEQTLA